MRNLHLGKSCAFDKFSAGQKTSLFRFGVLRGSVVKCLTRNPGVLGLSPTGSSGFFRGSVLGQDTSEPSLALVKPRKDMNKARCCHDMTEILLKSA